jgi:hypothetical protein
LTDASSSSSTHLRARRFALSLAVLPAAASATATQGEIDTAIGKAVEYVRERQAPATGEPNDPESGFVFERFRFGGDWVAGALAAAGVNSADVAAGGPSLQDFLLSEYGSASGWWSGSPDLFPEEYERPTLAAFAAGLDPARLSAEVNLPAQIAGTWNPATGSFGQRGGQAAYYAAFGILALRRSQVPTWVLSPAVEALGEVQEDDGSWSEELVTVADMTATAAAALCEAGVPPYDSRVGSALAYLKGQQANATGGIESGNAESASRLLSAQRAQRAQRLQDRPAVAAVDDRGGQDAGRSPALAAGELGLRGRRLLLLHRRTGPTSTRPRTRCGRSPAASSPPLHRLGKTRSCRACTRRRRWPPEPRCLTCWRSSSPPAT